MDNSRVARRPSTQNSLFEETLAGTGEMTIMSLHAKGVDNSTVGPENSTLKPHTLKLLRIKGSLRLYDEKPLTANPQAYVRAESSKKTMSTADAQRHIPDGAHHCALEVIHPTMMLVSFLYTRSPLSSFRNH